MMMMKDEHNSIRIWTDKVDEKITLALAALEEDCFVVEMENGYVIVCNQPVSLLPLVLWTLDEMDCKIEGMRTLRYCDNGEAVYNDLLLPEAFTSVMNTISTIASNVCRIVTSNSRDK